MKVRPILFSAPMVRALLEGRKTQTRRIVKPQPPANVRDAGVIASNTKSHGTWWWLDSIDLMEASAIGDDFRCPYGVSGDLLWVRETWKPAHRIMDARYLYHADLMAPSLGSPWKPAIHMPRAASRLTLRLTNVRVERLNVISDADCIAEGVDLNAFKLPGDTAVVCYRRIWEEIHGSFSWGDNPWVWALTFEVLRENVDALTDELARDPA